MPIEDIPFYTVMGEEISRNILSQNGNNFFNVCAGFFRAE